MLEKSNLFQSSEKAILVGVALKEQKDHQVNEYLQELAFLATTAGAVTAKTFIQKLQHPDLHFAFPVTSFPLNTIPA